MYCLTRNCMARLLVDDDSRLMSSLLFDCKVLVEVRFLSFLLWIGHPPVSCALLPQFHSAERASACVSQRVAPYRKLLWLAELAERNMQSSLPSMTTRQRLVGIQPLRHLRLLRWSHAPGPASELRGLHHLHSGRLAPGRVLHRVGAVHAHAGARAAQELHHH